MVVRLLADDLHSAAELQPQVLQAIVPRLQEYYCCREAMRRGLFTHQRTLSLLRFAFSFMEAFYQYHGDR